ncbi:hypothetical protein QBC42DRAFT_265427 [Cladorrhinum samala]|uniref:Protein kinase domain-containing protein n=1 Tax=Cladorrhinum samala TaxID=585594 RepID=A0AAV9HU80_9PEZI|nr:hypothetical protein QBC42DRAFT_265427 [Cladorrhinum samala]
MAELGLAVVATIDLCIIRGNDLITKYKTFRDADAKLEELVVRIEICWRRVTSQVSVTKQLASTMSQDYNNLQQRILRVLDNKLTEVELKVSEFSTKMRLGVGRKLKFALFKDGLERAIEDLESWQKRYELDWFQLIKAAPSTVDLMLNQAILEPSSGAPGVARVAREFRRGLKQLGEADLPKFIQESRLQECEMTPIPFSTAVVATRPNGAGRLIVDAVNLEPDSVQRKDAREFSHRLRHADPDTFGLLACKGVVVHGNPKGRNGNMSILFRVPQHCASITSLRELLLRGTQHESLSDRLYLAKQLTKAVYYVHLYGFVHKNIRPETILSLGKMEEGDRVPRTAFLVGFQVIRNADGRTYPVSASNEWQLNLYRHPERQTDAPEYFVMQHDIYSLGVCLLEIGLWEPFVKYDAEGVALPTDTFLQLIGNPLEIQDGRKIKEKLVDISRSTVLRARMGTKYGHLVETCLTCLDADNMDFGDEVEFQDEGGVTVAVRYIEKVLGVLDGISL